MDKAADKWKTGIEKHALVGDTMANDQMEGVFAKNLDWIPRYIILDKTGKNSALQSY
jgi:hypothetical protein